MSIELVVTDLDGTLFDAKQTIDEQTLRAIQFFRNKGITVLAATARGPKSTSEIFNRHNLAIPAVLCNGAMGRLADGSAFHSAAFSKTAAQEILQIFDEASLVPHIPVDHQQYGAIVPPNASSCAQFIEQTRTGVLVADTEAAVEHDVVAFRLLGLDRDALEDVANRCTARTDTRVYFHEDSLYGKWSLQIGPAAANKWAGVIAFCESTDIDATQVLGIGNDHNDIDYLRNARISVAMPNSPPEVIAIVDHVLQPHQTWAAIIDYV